MLAALAFLASRGLAFQHHLQPQTRALDPAGVDEVVHLDELDQRMRTLNETYGFSYLPPRRHVMRRGTRVAPDPSGLRPAQVRELGPFDPCAFYTDDDVRQFARSIYAADVRLSESS